MQEVTGSSPVPSTTSPDESVWGFFVVTGREPEQAKAGYSAVGVLQTLVVALGAGLGIWGVINLLEGYGQDNPASNAHVR